MYADHERQRVDHRRLHQRPQTAGQRLAGNKRAAGRWADEVLVQHPEVALPDDRDAEEDRGEECALG